MAGKWAGDATVQRGPGGPITIRQTEDIRFKFDGLVLLVEGTGRDRESGKVLFNALAVISYDDIAKAYRIRAYTDGRGSGLESPGEAAFGCFER